MSRADFKKHYNRGRQLAQKGHFHDAIDAYQAALSLKPTDVNTVFQLGNVSKAMHLYDVAIKWYDVALSLAPSKTEIAFNRAIALAAAGRNDDALRAYQLIEHQMTKDAMFWNSLGTLYLQMGLLQNAIEALEQAVTIKPGYAEAWHNLAIGYFDSRRLKDYDKKWEKAFAKAERQLRGDPSFHVTRGTSRLAVGDYERGWQDYAYRHKPSSKCLSVVYDHTVPWWKGERLAGKTILIGEEQGIGDQITFLSALPDLIEQARHVILEVNAKLAQTFARNYPSISVITADAETKDLKRFHRYTNLPRQPDFFTPLGDMFHTLRPSLADFKGNTNDDKPILTACPVHYKKWSDRLSGIKKKKIGVSWRSQKITGARQAYYMDFQMLVPWMQKYPDVQFVNLQYGDCTEELDFLKKDVATKDLLLNFPDLDLFDDIEGTLGLIANLDMVFSVRNSQASFAGALGIPTLAYYESFFQFGRKYTDPVFQNTLAVHPQDGDGAVLQQLDQAISSFEEAYNHYKELDF